jgi:peptide/nickel transport system substrate-binding protein
VLLILAGSLLAPGCHPEQRLAPRNVHISVPHEIATFDPHATATLSHLTMVLHVYEPLVTVDGDLRLRPCLAQDWENPDARTWLFRLRPGVRFQSGRELRARDVVYSLQRTIDSAGEASLAPYVEDVTAVDENTVRIRTFHPFSALLNKLRFALIVPEGATAAAFADGGDGTGPYHVDAWKKGDWIRFRRNDGYWGPAPALETVTFHLDRNPDQALHDLRTGVSQVARCDSRACIEALSGSDHFTVARRPSLLVRALVFGMGSAPSPYVDLPFNPFRDPRVREAMDLAIDRTRLCRRLTSRADPANQPVPRLVFGFNPEIPDPRPDPDRARALLREAGLEGGFGLTLHVRGILGETAEAVREQLEEVGIRARIEPMPWGELQGVLESGQARLYLAAYACITGDASDVLDHYLHSYDPKRRLGLANHGRYSNPEVDRRIEEGASLDDPHKRGDALQATLAQVVKDRSWLPLYTNEAVFVFERSLAWSARDDGLLLAAEFQPRPAD